MPDEDLPIVGLVDEMPKASSSLRRTTLAWQKGLVSAWTETRKHRQQASVQPERHLQGFSQQSLTCLPQMLNRRLLMNRGHWQLANNRAENRTTCHGSMCKDPIIIAVAHWPAACRIPSVCLVPFGHETG